LAEYAEAAEKYLASKPESMSYEATSALPLAVVTTLQALTDKGGIFSRGAGR